MEARLKLIHDDIVLGETGRSQPQLSILCYHNITKVAINPFYINV